MERNKVVCWLANRCFDHHRDGLGQLFAYIYHCGARQGFRNWAKSPWNPFRKTETKKYILEDFDYPLDPDDGSDILKPGD